MLGKNLSQRKSMIPFQKEVTLNNLRKSRGMTGKEKYPDYGFPGRRRKEGLEEANRSL